MQCHRFAPNSLHPDLSACSLLQNSRHSYKVSANSLMQHCLYLGILRILGFSCLGEDVTTPVHLLL